MSSHGSCRPAGSSAAIDDWLPWGWSLRHAPEAVSHLDSLGSFAAKIQRPNHYALGVEVPHRRQSTVGSCRVQAPKSRKIAANHPGALLKSGATDYGASHVSKSKPFVYFLIAASSCVKTIVGHILTSDCHPHSRRKCREHPSSPCWALRYLPSLQSFLFTSNRSSSKRFVNPPAKALSRSQLAMESGDK